MFNELANKLDKISLNISEPHEIDLTPPENVATEAKKGIDWQQQYNRGGGLVGLMRAHQLANKTKLSLDIIKRMNRFFIRHQKNKNSTNSKGEPGNGQIAWALWGGNAGWDWVKSVLQKTK